MMHSVRRSRLARFGLPGAALLLLAMNSPSLAADPPLLTYDDVMQAVAGWEKRGVMWESAAVSEEGRIVPLVRIGNGPVRVLFLNALHANEPTGTEAFVRLVWALAGETQRSFDHTLLPSLSPQSPVFRALADATVRDALLSRVTILGFPMLDPDGVENDRTRNSLSNADYLTQILSISRAIQYAVDRYGPDVIVDSHGGPDAPDLNIGLVEPYGIEEATRFESRRVGDQMWRIAVAHGIMPAYFEEHPFALLLGQHGDPFRSADEAYYASLARTAPFTQESHQLSGIPMLYTETVGLQSMAPSITITEGASAQQVSMAGIALERSGLLDARRPVAFDAPAETPITVDVHGPATLYARASWNAAGTDYRLTLADAAGNPVSAGGTRSASTPVWQKARALRVEGLPSGTYTLSAERIAGQDIATVRAVWWEPDDAPGPAWLANVIDPNAQPQLCFEESSAFGDAATSTDQTGFLAPPVCAPPASGETASVRSGSSRLGAPSLPVLLGLFLSWLTRMVLAGRAGAAAVIAVLFLVVPVADAGIYKWVDKSGRVHFSDRPPAEAQAQDVREAESAEPADLASCLSQKGFRIYGASWCPQCEKQKRMFGINAWRLPYTECSADGTKKKTGTCDELGIAGYPTWVFPDGRRQAGVYSKESLARISGCPSS